MSPSERSVLVFGLYLLPLGAGLALAPALVLAPFGLPAPTEVWVRVLGVVVLASGSYYIQAARHGMTAFVAWTVPVRAGVFAAFVALVLAGLAPEVLIVFGVVDLAGALWTHLALQRNAASIHA